MDYFRTRNKCVLFAGNVESGNFFEGLRRYRTSSGTEFRRRSAKVDNFPTTLKVFVTAAADKCTTQNASGDEGHNDFPEVDGEFMRSLHFEAFWKQGFEMKRADLGVVNEGRIPSPTMRSESADWWSYQLEITSQHIPLTSSLIIAILSDDGNTIARLSLRL